MVQVTVGSSKQTIQLCARETVNGTTRTGLTCDDITVAYTRTRSKARPVTLLELSSPDAEHADGGFIEIDAVSQRGWYRLDLPDAVFARGADFVTVTVQANNVEVPPSDFQLIEALPVDLAREVHLCKAALVNKRVHTVSTGVDEIKDDDGVTTLVTMTPTDGGEDVIEVVPS